MRITIVSILIFPSLLYMACAYGVVPLAGTENIPCNEKNEEIISPVTERFWELNQTNFEILFSTPQDCIYLYMITEILITTNDHMKENINEYSISYKLNNSSYFVRLRDLSTSTYFQAANGTLVQIKPLLVEEISIMKFINSSGNFSVRYKLKGNNISRVTVLNYLIAQPENRTTYNGLCNGKICYGGRGELMDGFGGNLVEATYSGATVRWKCDNTSTACSYPLQMILTRQVNVSHIIIYGFKHRNEDIVSPNISLIQPRISTDQITNNISANNAYSIKIPINTVTDEIYLYMNISVKSKLALSEVEVFSNGVNIALLQNNYTSSSYNESNGLPPCNMLRIIFGSTIGVMIIMIILSVGFSTYITIKYRNVKHQLDTLKPPLSQILENLKRNPTPYITDENARYSQRSLNQDLIYSIIGPGCLTGDIMRQNTNDSRYAKIDTRHIIANAFTEMEGLTENPIYASVNKIPSSIETLETLLQPPIENCKNNYQDTNQARNVEKFEEKEEPECERDYLQDDTQGYEMRDNPIYKEVKFKSQKDEQLELNNGGKPLSVYDVKY